MHSAIEGAGQENAAKDELFEAVIPDFWYKLMTIKIDNMRKVELLLIDSLLLSEDADLAEEYSHVPVSTGEDTLKLEPKTTRFLRTLPFFSNLNQALFDQLIEAARTRTYKKGQTLFLEREQPTRFYIILDGWIKLFKGSASGEESILQMLSGGDSIIASAVFLNAPYPLSAQIAEDTVLVSFPAPMVRQLVRDNNDLAVNMLTNLSERSQMLLQQVEMVRLKSAAERVGWFLLKTLMEQSDFNSRGKNSIKLPYDKAMIASYLDMTPETFSRNLKRLKHQGYRIEKDTIFLPNVANVLCGYCDTDIASVCSKHNTVDCPNPHCVQGA